jgi:acyl-CoA reductase-like NAD-dependent aldehyde dehydrogenase
VVAPDADLNDALPRLLKGGFYHAGQVCVSVQRIYAHESIARKLADDLAAGASRLVVGDPTDARTEVGPLIRPAEVTRVHAWVQDAIAGGAERLCGGEPIGETCYSPTVLFNPTDDATLSTQEIFGPVVCVYPYASLDEAIERANALPFSFQSSVFTRDIDTALRCYNRFSAATVVVNDHTAFRVDWMPFAGAKVSGLGVGGIPYTLHDMQVEKLLVLRSDHL